jgi:XXXCH domain-containing protein
LGREKYFSRNCNESFPDIQEKDLRISHPCFAREGPMEQKNNSNVINQIQTNGEIPRDRVSNYRAFQETRQAGLKPPWALFETFMKEVDLITTYKRHGKEFYEKVSYICSTFEKAFIDNDFDRLVELYEELEELKITAAFLPT